MATNDWIKPDGTWGDLQIPFDGTVTPGYWVAMKAYVNQCKPLKGMDSPFGTITQWKKDRASIEILLRNGGWVILRGQTIEELKKSEPDYTLQYLLPWMEQQGITKLENWT